MNDNSNRRSGCSGRLIIAAVIAIISVISYYSATSVNPITGNKQHISITKDQEIALGLQATPQMEQEYGGEDTDPQRNAIVDDVGAEVVATSAASTSDHK